MANWLKTESVMENGFSSILNTAKGVITNPVEFFRDMPKSGGFGPPLIFAVVVATVAGVVRTLLGILGIGFVGTLGTALALIVITPIVVAISSFIGAVVMFFIWRLMGSQESYETAFRCGAYASAISPIVSVLNVIPYLGAILGLAWMMYLLVVASVEVHNIESQKAWMVFGILFALFAILSLWSEHSARNLSRRMDQFQRQLQNTEEMTPEEAGKAMGEFLKGLQKGAEEKQ